MLKLLIVSMSLLLLNCSDKRVIIKDHCTVTKNELGYLLKCPNQTALQIRDGINGLDGKSCDVTQLDNGALISCPDSSSVILNGKDSLLGINELINPCGESGLQYEEILLRLSDNSIVAYFENGNKRFLSQLSSGDYVTTDGENCYFTIDENNNIIYK